MPKTKKTKATKADAIMLMFKSVDQMTGPEVVNEAEGLASYAESCRSSGQGINSKEVIRFNKCIERIENERLTEPYNIVSIRTRWDERMNRSDFRDMLMRIYQNGGTLEGMRKLFAPA